MNNRKSSNKEHVQVDIHSFPLKKIKNAKNINKQKWI